jgi:dTDP-3-amino-3,4,6-trideoxy-alpha-D-glucose transaminase
VITLPASNCRFIPQADPGLQYRRHQEAIDVAIARVLTRGHYILGPEVEAFEEEFAAFCGAKYGVGVASGTDAVRLALLGMGIGKGDEVIVPAHTAVATVTAVERAGSLPVLVDIEADTYTLDAGAVADAITPRTRAIVAVHLYGHPADLARLVSVAERHGVPLVEDCAQAHGALWRQRPVGSIGVMGCFSFYPTKNLGALGDGGAVVTNDVRLAERVRLLRQYGWAERNVSTIAGDNSRLDELQAAVLRAKLVHLDADTNQRRNLAAAFTEALRPLVDTPVERPDCRHVYHLYVVATAERSGFQRRLTQLGVGTGVHYPFPIHLQPAYEGRLGRRGQFPAAERACERVVSLPLYPGLQPEEVERVLGAVRATGVCGG